MTRPLKRLAVGFTILSAFFTFLFFSLPLPGTIPVLMYHFVGSKEEAGREGNWVSRESFAKQMAFLKKFHYRVITIHDYYAIQSGKRKPQGREILVTFDDGHRSFKTEAVPVLERHGLPSTLFLVSDFVRSGGEDVYKDSMNIQEIQQLQRQAGISFQGHTKTHPHLKELKDEELEWELTESKKELEALLGQTVEFLAYPFGEVDRRVLAATKKAGYKMAFSTSFKKLEDIPEGLLTQTRIKISDSSDSWIIFWLNISGLQQEFKEFRQKMKYRL